MNKKTVNVLLLLTAVILAGAQASLAQPQYLTSLIEVYGNGSCTTCHINATGGGPRTPYGTLFENQPNHITNSSAALRTIGAPPTANATIRPTAVLTPAATLNMTAVPTAIATAVPTAIPTAVITPRVTTVTTTPTATEAPRTPGFGIVSSILGLFILVLLAKRNNK